jgi:hypothetical protein
MQLSKCLIEWQPDDERLGPKRVAVKVIKNEVVLIVFTY